MSIELANKLLEDLGEYKNSRWSVLESHFELEDVSHVLYHAPSNLYIVPHKDRCYIYGKYGKVGDVIFENITFSSSKLVIKCLIEEIEIRFFDLKAASDFSDLPFNGIFIIAEYLPLTTPRLEEVFKYINSEFSNSEILMLEFLSIILERKGFMDFPSVITDILYSEI